MAYDIKTEMDKLLKMKEGWHIGNNVKHQINGKDARDYYSEKAKEIYKGMEDNGYGAVAGSLKKKNYAEAKKYAKEYYIKTGRSAFRPYMYQQGEAWGMSKEDVDKLISYDNTTGEITFAGKNIGKPAGVVNGVSYMDAGDMQKAWDDFTVHKGLTRSSEKLAGINSEDVRKMANKLFDTSENDSKLKYDKYGRLEDYIYDHDPYSSEIGKSIMEDYKLKGDTASDGAIAEVAGSNGGNIDSFAAANGARQQLAFTNAGKKAVLDDFNLRIANARGALSDMGVQIQADRDNMYNAMLAMQNEGQRQSEISRSDKLAAQQIENEKTDNLVKQAGVTGYTPKEWTDGNNPYLNKDGTLKNVSIDYNSRIKQLEEQLKTETDPGNVADIKKNIGWLNDARAVKVSMPEYSKYASDRPVIFSDLERSADYDLTNKQIESAERMANTGYDTERAINKENTDASIRMNETTQNAENARNSANNAVTKSIAEMDKDVQLEKLRAEMGVVNMVAIPDVDYDVMDVYGINDNGTKFLEELKREADAMGGAMTNSEILQFVLDNAGKHKVKLKEVKKIYNFLGISATPLERMEDVAKDDSSKGIKIKGT